jgi:hypothetical protein
MRCTFKIWGDEERERRKKEEGRRKEGERRTSNQSCHSLIIPSLTLITAAVCVVLNLK